MLRLNHIVGGLAVCGLAAFASAGPISSFSFSWSMGSGHAASAGVLFDSTAGVNTMVITLTNDMAASHDNAGSRALTGLFFDIAGDPTIGMSGVVTSPNAMVGGTSGGQTTNPNDYWAFRENLDTEPDMPAAFGGARYGLGAAGFDVFSNGDILGTPYHSNQPNGIDGGILSATASIYGGSNQTPLVRTTAVFTFALAAGFFDGNYVPVMDNVNVQFGSGFDEPSSIPLPTGVAMGVVGLGLVVVRRRRVS